MDGVVSGKLSFGMACFHVSDAHAPSRTVDGAGGTGAFAVDGGHMVCGGALHDVYQNPVRVAGGCGFASGLHPGSGRGNYAHSGCVYSADDDLPLYGAHSAHRDDDGRRGGEAACICRAVFVALHGHGHFPECLSDFETYFALRLERMHDLQEKGKGFITKYGFRLVLFAALLLLFLLLGHDGPVMFDDSGSYMWIRWHEGVMPAYPLFLLFNECLFGYQRYLWMVVIEQAVLAAFSVTVLEETVRARFGLHPVEGILVCLFALYPYTIEMPEAVMTQAVLTEGVAYSLFYLFLALLLKSVWDKNYIRLAGAFGMTLLLSAVRSQLQILFGVCGIVFFYLICMRGRRENRTKRLLRALAGFAGCAVVSMAGVLLVLGLIRGYRFMLQEEHFLGRLGIEVQWPRMQQTYLEEEEAAQAEAAEEPEAEEQEELPQAKSAAEAELFYQNFSTSQYMTLIFSRGMYEGDYEDTALFQDEVLRGLYLALYEAVDAEGQRYAYADEGLWMWKDIVGGIGKIGGTCIWIPSEYYLENAPEILMSDQFSDIRSSHLLTIGWTLIRAHFGRFLYHTLMLLPQAFISTVFFQFAPLYGLCHLITAFLYLSAIALMIWGYKDALAKREGAEMMSLVLGTNAVMVIVISLVFFGQQRYLVYAFGPFYIAYYLLLRNLWHARVRSLVKRRLLPEKKDGLKDA